MPNAVCASLIGAMTVGALTRHDMAALREEKAEMAAIIDGRKAEIENLQRQIDGCETEIGDSSQTILAVDNAVKTPSQPAQTTKPADTDDDAEIISGLKSSSLLKTCDTLTKAAMVIRDTRPRISCNTAGMIRRCLEQADVYCRMAEAQTADAGEKLIAGKELRILRAMATDKHLSPEKCRLPDISDKIGKQDI